MTNGEAGRRYDDKEIRRLLARAVELQREEGASSSAGTGLTLSELSEIARESGIDPRYVRRAAEELERSPGRVPEKALFTGHPATVRLERVIQGEIPERTFEVLAAEIQMRAGVPGQPSLLGRTLTWRAESPARNRNLQVIVTSGDGETRILIEERLHHLAAGLFAGLMGGLGVGLGWPAIGVGLVVIDSALAAVALPLAMVGGSYILARFAFTRLARGRSGRLHDLLQRLTEVVEKAARRAVPGSTPGRQLPETPAGSREP